MSNPLCRILGTLALAGVAWLPLAASAETLTLGSISENVKKHLVRFEPLADYLAAGLADDGITAVDVRVLPTSDEMINAMRDGEVDLFFDSPLVATNVADRAGGEPFLRRWKDGVATYHSVIIVPVDSEIETIADLVGHRVGFQEPDSTSGFLLPAAFLRRAGLELQELRSKESEPEAEVIGYVFTSDDKNTVSWLHRGWIDAAATDPGSFEELDAALPGQFRIIARTIEVPRQIVVRGAGLSPELQDRIAEVLVTMDQTEEGREVLAQFNETDRFDHFPDGLDQTFEPIREVLAELNRLNLY